MSNQLSTNRGTAASFLNRVEQRTGRQPLVTSGPKTAAVHFRCAVTGKAFQAILTQESPKHRFQISKMSNPADGAASSQHVTAGPPLAQAPDIHGGLVQSREFNVAQFDFSGWYCPHCSHGRNNSGESFVCCGVCKELVCGARIRKLDHGARLFTCHNGCGGGGQLSGYIESCKAESSDPAGLLGFTSQKFIGEGSATGKRLLPK